MSNVWTCDGDWSEVGIDEVCGCHIYECEKCGFRKTIHYSFCKAGQILAGEGS